MLLLEKGDIDIARNLEADQVASLQGNAEIALSEVPKGALYYLGLNQRNEHLARPEVRKALKYLVDYQGIADTILAGSPPPSISHSCPRAFSARSATGPLRSTCPGPRRCSPRRAWQTAFR